MKKIYTLTILLLLLAGLPSLAQTNDPAQIKTPQPLFQALPSPDLAQPSFSRPLWYIGVGGNFNSTWIINQNTYTEPKLTSVFTPGFAGNFNLGLEYSKHFGFKAELGIAFMGQKYTGTQYDLPVSRNIKLNYLVLPLLLKYRTTCGIVKFYLAAGPELGILLSATQTYLRNGVDAPPLESSDHGTIDVSKHDIRDRYNGEDGSARFDFGVELVPFDHFMIVIGESTLFDITDLNKYSWRFVDANGRYGISHDFYTGVNVGFNFMF